jgi:hypothetical protein
MSAGFMCHESGKEEERAKCYMYGTNRISQHQVFSLLVIASCLETEVTRENAAGTKAWKTLSNDSNPARTEIETTSSSS